jgi:phenylpyruvate tautomerase PptA (4-oxalocrotonate tautomerase family)
MWSGVSREAKARIIKDITKVFEELGIPGQAVEVITHEVLKENWEVERELVSRKFKKTKSSQVHRCLYGDGWRHQAYNDCCWY